MFYKIIEDISSVFESMPELNRKSESIDTSKNSKVSEADLLTNFEQYQNWIELLGQKYPDLPRLSEDTGDDVVRQPVWIADIHCSK